MNTGKRMLTLPAAALLIAWPLFAGAAPQRTFVSTAGDDTNPCSLTSSRGVLTWPICGEFPVTPCQRGQNCRPLGATVLPLYTRQGLPRLSVLTVAICHEFQVTPRNSLTTLKKVSPACDGSGRDE